LPQRITIITGVVGQLLALVLKNCWLPCPERSPDLPIETDEEELPSKELLDFAGKELLLL
jgi:hypothetical protein